MTTDPTPNPRPSPANLAFVQGVIDTIYAALGERHESRRSTDRARPWRWIATPGGVRTTPRSSPFLHHYQPGSSEEFQYSLACTHAGQKLVRQVEMSHLIQAEMERSRQ